MKMKMTPLVVLIATAALAVGAAADGLSGRDEVVQRAKVLAARQAWAEAASAYEAAVAASPRDAVLHNQLGICYQRLGETKSARNAYRTAISLNQDYAEAHNNLGTLEHTRRRYKQAISAYRKAIAIKPEPAFYENLGGAWLARGDVDQALAAWSEAIRLDPTGLEGGGVKVAAADVDLARQYFLYAKLLAAQGQADKALDYLGKAHAAGFSDFAKVERDRDFASLVADPRYTALK
jgi:tetratricopeptide (TPR) repeat protein